jgi:hypothetical protein
MDNVQENVYHFKLYLLLHFRDCRTILIFVIVFLIYTNVSTLPKNLLRKFLYDVLHSEENKGLRRLLCYYLYTNHFTTVQKTNDFLYQIYVWLTYPT